MHNKNGSINGGESSKFKRKNVSINNGDAISVLEESRVKMQQVYQDLQDQPALFMEALKQLGVSNIRVGGSKK